MNNIKRRLDQLLVCMYPEYSRRQLQDWIASGKVMVDGRVEVKSGCFVSDTMNVTLMVEPPKYVSRAGFKLEKALDFFAIKVENLVVLDAGLSTGGFSDCLLQRGVEKIYGIDVGFGQVHHKIRSDARVVVKEKVHIKEVISVVEELVDLVTLDLSFISVLKVIEVVSKVLKPGGHLIVLIKPQFEVGKQGVGRSGIVKESKYHEEAINRVTAGITLVGFLLQGVIESPFTGADGNREFLAYFKKNKTI